MVSVFLIVATIGISLIIEQMYMVFRREKAMKYELMYNFTYCQITVEIRLRVYQDSAQYHYRFQAWSHQLHDQRTVEGNVIHAQIELVDIKALPQPVFRVDIVKDSISTADDHPNEFHAIFEV